MIGRNGYRGQTSELPGNEQGWTRMIGKIDSGIMFAAGIAGYRAHRQSGRQCGHRRAARYGSRTGCLSGAEQSGEVCQVPLHGLALSQNDLPGNARRSIDERSGPIPSGTGLHIARPVHSRVVETGRLQAHHGGNECAVPSCTCETHMRPLHDPGARIAAMRGDSADVSTRRILARARSGQGLFA